MGRTHNVRHLMPLWPLLLTSACTGGQTPTPPLTQPDVNVPTSDWTSCWRADDRPTQLQVITQAVKKEQTSNKKLALAATHSDCILPNCKVLFENDYQLLINQVRPAFDVPLQSWKGGIHVPRSMLVAHYSDGQTCQTGKDYSVRPVDAGQWPELSQLIAHVPVVWNETYGWTKCQRVELPISIRARRHILPLKQESKPAQYTEMVLDRADCQTEYCRVATPAELVRMMDQLKPVFLETLIVVQGSPHVPQRSLTLTYSDQAQCEAVADIQTQPETAAGRELVFSSFDHFTKAWLALPSGAATDPQPAQP